MDWIKIIPELIRDISVAFAAWAAIYGIDAWRREFRGTRQIELAEETLALIYQARDAIRSIRGPFGHSAEGRTRKAGDNETPEEKESRDRAYAFYERYERHQELFAKLRAIQYRFMAAFGREAAKPFETFPEVLNELSVASMMLAELWTERSRFNAVASGLVQQEDLQERLSEINKEIREYKQVIWWHGGKDVLDPKIEGAVQTLETICRNVIEAKGSLYGVINLPVLKRKK